LSTPRIQAVDLPGRSQDRASDLSTRHFVMQGSRPSHVKDVEVSAMDSFLRTLLFTDGTVTRTLEVHTLSRVSVEVIDQAKSLASARVANYLQLPDGAELTKRRVSIGIGAATKPIIWAESHIIPDRLPPGFLGLLDRAPDGIGEALQQVKLESWREMLWFGLDLPPDWARVFPVSQTGLTVLKRLYRVIIQSRPALLICESFAVGQQAGAYHLLAADSQMPLDG
jgi:4-hydroxybenzoate synthetase (chorismate lyase)